MTDASEACTTLCPSVDHPKVQDYVHPIGPTRCGRLGKVVFDTHCNATAANNADDTLTFTPVAAQVCHFQPEVAGRPHDNLRLLRWRRRKGQNECSAYRGRLSKGDGQQLDGGVIDDYGKGSYGIAPNRMLSLGLSPVFLIRRLFAKGTRQWERECAREPSLTIGQASCLSRST